MVVPNLVRRRMHLVVFLSGIRNEVLLCRGPARLTARVARLVSGIDRSLSRPSKVFGCYSVHVCRCGLTLPDCWSRGALAATTNTPAEYVRSRLAAASCTYNVVAVSPCATGLAAISSWHTTWMHSPFWNSVCLDCFSERRNAYLPFSWFFYAQATVPSTFLILRLESNGID